MIPAGRTAVARNKSAGQPMPWNPELDLLASRGVVFRRGQLVLVAGFPGGGKSTLALWLAQAWGLRTLYISADTSETDMRDRLGALVTGRPASVVRDAFERNTSLADSIAAALEVDSAVSFVFDTSPTPDDILDEMDAWVEAWDEYPPVIVIDNLIDIDMLDSDGDTTERWKTALLWLKSLVRETGSTVIVLHHARELGKSTHPAAAREIAGKITQTPELVITTAMEGDQFRLAVVKNRSGWRDPEANSGFAFTFSDGVNLTKNGLYNKPPSRSGWQ